MLTLTLSEEPLMIKEALVLDLLDGSMIVRRGTSDKGKTEHSRETPGRQMGPSSFAGPQHFF